MNLMLLQSAKTALNSSENCFIFNMDAEDFSEMSFLTLCHIPEDVSLTLTDARTSNVVCSSLLS
jgi:hypothetical protein